MNTRPAGGKNKRPAHAQGHATFEAIVRRHGATVQRVCRASLGPADADDAWSDTFLAAVRDHSTLPVDAWLVTIAHRKAIDTLWSSCAGRRSPRRSLARRPSPHRRRAVDRAALASARRHRSDTTSTADAATPASARAWFHVVHRRRYVGQYDAPWSLAGSTASRALFIGTFTTMVSANTPTT